MRGAFVPPYEQKLPFETLQKLFPVINTFLTDFLSCFSCCHFVIQTFQGALC